MGVTLKGFGGDVVTALGVRRSGRGCAGQGSGGEPATGRQEGAHCGCIEEEAPGHSGQDFKRKAEASGQGERETRREAPRGAEGSP